MKKVNLLSMAAALSIGVSAQTTCTLSCNGDFEDVTYGPTVSMVQDSTVPCWNTTAPDHIIEVWHNGYNSVPAYSGNQFVELNAYYQSTLYQNISVNSGDIITIKFAHRGRAGVDVMGVEVGPIGGPYTSLGTFSDNNANWGYYTVNYNVPTSGAYYVRFVSISAAGGNSALGNFLDAVLITKNCGSTPDTTCNFICNGDFESGYSGATVGMLQDSVIPCWHTTASDGYFEFWASGYNSVPAYSGNYFIELNAYQQSTIYQDFNINPGKNIQIGFAHRGRMGTDVVGVEIGPVGGPYNSLGTFADGNVNWGYYTINYTIPNGFGNNYRIRFVSVSAAGGSSAIGNFLDKISISCTDSITSVYEIKNEGFKIYPNPANEKMFISNINSSPVFVEIFDVSGNKVYFNKLTSNEVDISQLSKGIYFVRINEQYYFKVIKE
ncbi:MAG: hypothetical protein OHK0036_00920 [Bacteroidia bacterium]